jgi:cytochrome oxidase Cu insertion factor (SCO1/SenC/PrrC family)
MGGEIMQRFELRACAAFLLAAGILSGCSGCSVRGGQVAEAAPTARSSLNTDSLKLVDLDGKPFDLRKASEGRVHVVVFTRSDCPVSNQFAPEIRGLFEKLHSQGVDFYLIYVDPTEKPEAIRDHLRQYEYPCTGLRDPEHSLVAQTGATVTPEAVVFYSDWRIAYRGRINDEYVEVGKSKTSSIRHDLQDAIEATLAGRPVAEPVTRAVGCYIGDLR